MKGDPEPVSALHSAAPAADDVGEMRPRAPLPCVQATAAAATARFRLWTDPPESDYEGSLDFAERAAAFHGTRRATGRVLQTVSLPDATFLREAGQRGWMRLHSSRWRQGSWDPFGVLDVVAAVPELVPMEPEPAQRGALRRHVGRLDAAAVEQLADDASTVMRRVRPLPPAGEDGEAEIARLDRQPPAHPSRPLPDEPPARRAAALRSLRLRPPGPGRDPRALRIRRPRRRPRRAPRRSPEESRSYTGRRSLPGGVIGSTPVSGSGSWGSSPCPAVGTSAASAAA